MLINCNSCHKKFIIPDNAVTKSGRLVQCGSCGSKWTQFPVKKNLPTKEKTTKIKKSIKAGETKKNLYTVEYLQKKHGISIKGSDHKTEDKKNLGKIKKNNFGFYSYIVVLFVFLTALYGSFHLFEELIITTYPASETYISYFYEVIDIIKISLSELFNYFLNL